MRLSLSQATSRSPCRTAKTRWLELLTNPVSATISEKTNGRLACVRISITRGHLMTIEPSDDRGISHLKLYCIAEL